MIVHAGWVILSYVAFVYTLCYKKTHTQLFGIINRGFYCYLKSVIQ